MDTLENSYIVACDLGTTNVVMSVARKSADGLVEVFSVKTGPMKGIEKGSLRNNEQISSSLKHVKNLVEKELNVKISEVQIAISGGYVQCARYKDSISIGSSEKTVGEVTQADVDRLTKGVCDVYTNNGQTVISIIPQFYNIDDESDIAEPVGVEGRRLGAEFNVIYGSAEIIERIKRCFRRAEMEVTNIVLQSIVSSYSVINDDEKELGVAVIDFGGGTTDMCVYADKIVRQISIVPLGSAKINKDIQANGILEKHVERLKTKYGSAVEDLAPANHQVTIPSVNGNNSRNLPHAMLARCIENCVGQIAEVLVAQIEASGYRLGAGVVLTGGGSLLKDIDVLFSRKFGCDARVAKPTYFLTEDAQARLNEPMYAVIAGILIDAIRNDNYNELEILEVEPDPEVVEEVPEIEVAQPPVQQTVQAPVQQTVQRPVQQTVQAPVQQTVQRPVQQTVQPPVQQTVQAPVQQTVQAPVQQTVQPPVQSPDTTPDTTSDTTSKKEKVGKDGFSTSRPQEKPRGKKGFIKKFIKNFNGMFKSDEMVDADDVYNDK